MSEEYQFRNWFLRVLCINLYNGRFCVKIAIPVRLTYADWHIIWPLSFNWPNKWKAKYMPFHIASILQHCFLPVWNTWQCILTGHLFTVKQDGHSSMKDWFSPTTSIVLKYLCGQTCIRTELSSFSIITSSISSSYRLPKCLAESLFIRSRPFDFYWVPARSCPSPQGRDTGLHTNMVTDAAINEAALLGSLTWDRVLDREVCILFMARWMDQ